MNTNEPQWNARYEVAVYDPRLTIELRVRSLGRVRDSEVGVAELQLGSLFRKAHDAEEQGSGVVTQDRWCSLIHKERACGMIHVRLEYVFSPLFDFVASFEEPVDFEEVARLQAAAERPVQEDVGYIDGFKQLRGNAYRFICSITPLLRAVLFVRDVLEWKNSALTLLSLFVFTWVVYHQLYVSALFFGTAGLMVRKWFVTARRVMRAEHTHTAINEDVLDNESVERMRTEAQVVLTELRRGLPPDTILQDMLTLGKIFHVLADIALMARHLFRLESDDEARRGRRYQVGYSWKREKRAIVALALGGLVFSALPLAYLFVLTLRIAVVAIVWYTATVAYVYRRYPRLRERFPPEWIWQFAYTEVKSVILELYSWIVHLIEDLRTRANHDGGGPSLIDRLRDTTVIRRLVYALSTSELPVDASPPQVSAAAAAQAADPLSPAAPDTHIVVSVSSRSQPSSATRDRSNTSSGSNQASGTPAHLLGSSTQPPASVPRSAHSFSWVIPSSSSASSSTLTSSASSSGSHPTQSASTSSAISHTDPASVLSQSEQATLRRLKSLRSTSSPELRALLTPTRITPVANSPIISPVTMRRAFYSSSTANRSTSTSTSRSPQMDRRRELAEKPARLQHTNRSNAAGTLESTTVLGGTSARTSSSSTKCAGSAQSSSAAPEPAATSSPRSSRAAAYSALEASAKLSLSRGLTPTQAHAGELRRYRSSTLPRVAPYGIAVVPQQKRFTEDGEEIVANGLVWKQSGTLIKTWSKRFLVLTSTMHLFYYKVVDSHGEVMREREPAGKIDLRGCMLLEVGPHVGKPFGLDLFDPREGRHHLIAAFSEEEQTQWLSELQTSIEKAERERALSPSTGGAHAHSPVDRAGGRSLANILGQIFDGDSPSPPSSGAGQPP